MAIVKMKKIAMVGIDTDKDNIISGLMDFGAVEILDQTQTLQDPVWAGETVADESGDNLPMLEAKSGKAMQALDTIEKFGNLKSGISLFKSRRGISKDRLNEIIASEDSGEKAVDFMLELAENIRNIREHRNSLAATIVALTPWTDLGVHLDELETEKTITILGSLPHTVNITEMIERLEAEIETVYLQVVKADKDRSFVAIVCSKDSVDEMLGIAKQQYGMSQINLEKMSGTAAENLERISKEKDIVKASLEAEKLKVAENAGLKETIENYADVIGMAIDKERIKTRLIKTKRTFFIEGWMPAACQAKAEEMLSAYDCFYEITEPAEDDEVPVLLKHNKFFTPFESVTEMYSLPDYRGVDPTSIYAIFYAVFFGMMFSDACYGLIMTVACLLITLKFRPEGNIGRMMKLFVYCGISTTVWGILFGGWFGNFFSVFAETILHKTVTINPLWFNPLDDPMKLLIFSIALGIIHIFIGMGIDMYMKFKDGHPLDAIFDNCFWYAVIIGIIAWIGGKANLGSAMISKVGMVLTIAGFVGLLVTGGRHKKGFGKVIGGLSSVYNITSYLSDILSYARLLALGLATGVIAQVVNTVGAMFGGGVKGAIILIVVFLIGHLLNFAINALGAYIHASRLQYVEFFGKFYKDGGEPFNPFHRNTKYIRVERVIK